MLFRIFTTVIALASLLVAAPPLANFEGIVHGVSKKQITIENPEGNLVDFEINGKTRVLRGKQRIAVEDLKTGDAVTVEARQEVERFLIAVTITVHDKT